MDKEDDITYFYFNHDGIEADDYEPVLIHGDNIAIISRYHWKLVTLWTDLQLLGEKPKITFLPSFHTPMAQCEDYKTKEYLHEKSSFYEKAKFRTLLFGFYGSVLPHVVFFDKKRGFNDEPNKCNDLMEENEVDAHYKFETNDTKFLVVISKSGELPESFLDTDFFKMMKT